MAGLSSEMQGVQAEIARLWYEADRLRGEWLRATDAFGKLGRGELESAVAVFTEWIVMEGSNPMPYIARGIAYWQGGNEQAARSDFKRASQLDPDRAPNVIRALKQEVKERTSPRPRRPDARRPPPKPPRLSKEERAKQLEKQAELYLELAKRFRNQGNNDTAKKWLEKTIQKAPASEPAKKAKEILDKIKE